MKLLEGEIFRKAQAPSGSSKSDGLYKLVCTSDNVNSQQRGFRNCVVRWDKYPSAAVMPPNPSIAPTDRHSPVALLHAINTAHKTRAEEMVVPLPTTGGAAQIFLENG
ncbi:hypothetical protein J6590_047436 [Homalodisca vitripennis]|nr:hypothetical protein J6590_047436 [Homalodisca vitripennis]